MIKDMNEHPEEEMHRVRYVEKGMEAPGPSLPAPPCVQQYGSSLKPVLLEFSGGFLTGMISH